MEQKCIMVLGMHRGGTSALAGLLDILGVPMGKTLMPANENNPKGYFENLIIYRFNDKKLLPRLGFKWDSTFSLPQGWENDTGLDDLYTEAEQVIHDEYGSAVIFGIKDPRMCRLLPFWQKVLTRMNVEICAIIPVRNSLEVAASLKKRNNYSIEKSILLWLIHQLEAEKNSRSIHRVFISFDEFINNNEKIVSAIDYYLGLNLFIQYNEKRDIVQKFIEGELRHHSIKKNSIENAPLFINSLLPIFDDIAINYTQEKDKVFREKLDDEASKFRDALNYFLNEDIQKQMMEYDLRILDKDRKIQEQVKSLQEKDKNIQDKDKVIQSLKNSYTWRTGRIFTWLPEKIVNNIRGLYNKYFKNFRTLK